MMPSSSAPFALWMSIPDPHHPGEMKTKNARMRIYDYLIRAAKLRECFLLQFLSIYYGMIAFIDHELGRLMASLERKGRLTNTIIVVTSDHGDFAAERHLAIKTGSLLDSMVRAPMIVSWPEQIDIMPTMLESCGTTVPRGVEGQRLPLPVGQAGRLRPIVNRPLATLVSSQLGRMIIAVRLPACPTSSCSSHILSEMRRLPRRRKRSHGRSEYSAAEAALERQLGGVANA